MGDVIHMGATQYCALANQLANESAVCCSCPISGCVLQGLVMMSQDILGHAQGAAHAGRQV